MKEKLFDIPIDKSLTSARRKAINEHITHNLRLSESPVDYHWEKGASEVLLIKAHPVVLEVKFQPKKVEIYGSAPLWARLLLTTKKKEELKNQIQLILTETGFFAEE